jgi:hypothetical protein
LAGRTTKVDDYLSRNLSAFLGEKEIIMEGKFAGYRKIYILPSSFIMRLKGQHTLF